MSHSPLNTTAPTAAFIPDAYIPRSGSAAYTVEHYDLDLDCKLGGNRLDGRARITAVAAGTWNGFPLTCPGCAPRGSH